MQKWEEFEQNATEFLNNLHSSFTFKNMGNNNSSTPDIKVYDARNLHIFNIEAKYSPAQAGQIVVLNDNGLFEFSHKSKNQKVDSTNLLIDHLNDNYDTYAGVAQAAIPINIDTDILYSFIEEQYVLKNNQWVIASRTAASLSASSLCLIPTDEIRNNFDISAVLRRKKSGTSEVPKLMRDRAKEIISYICDDPEFETTYNKTFFYGDIGTHPYELPENIYLSKKETNRYEIRKRSKTNNPNIMFSLKLKSSCKYMGEEFLAYLNSF